MINEVEEGTTMNPIHDDIENNESDKVDDVEVAYVPPQNLADRSNFEFSVIMIGSSLLSFHAGFVNGVCMLANNIGVTHMTGTTTRLGIDVGEGLLDNAMVNLCLIINFIFGASIAGFNIDGAFKLGASYGPLFFIGSGIFLLACLCEIYDSHDLYFLYFAAMGSGLQNGLTTKYSGNVLRTTHMTGTATDLGILLGRWWGRGESKEFWRFYLLVPIFVAFCAGGIISVPIFHAMGRLSLIISVILFLSIGILYVFIVAWQMETSIFKAFSGMFKKVENATNDTMKDMKEKIDHMKSIIV
jgi:uncharacterized membrane protein YoaK (UPF0700 family)